MKILIVSSVQTDPTTSGSGSFIKKYTSLLKKMGHDVYFLHVTFYAIKKSNKQKIAQGVKSSAKEWGDKYFHYQMNIFDKIKELSTSLYHKAFTNYFSGCDNRYPIGLHHYVNKLNSKIHFDACIVNYYWFTKLLTKIDIPKRGIMTHDSFTYNNMRNNVKSILNLTPNEEAKALQRCPFIFAMQNEEKIFFQRLAPKSKIFTSYCNYDFNDQTYVGNHNLVMLSSSFYLNINGFNWFITNIFPLILDEFPDCHLIIGGSLCTAISQYRSHPNIDLLGYIDDASDLYQLGDIAINPTYQGTGLKIKTFESIAYNKITMVHPHSMTGIFDKEHAPIFASDQPKEWLNFLRKVWTDTKYAETIRKNNKTYIENMNNYILEQFKHFLQ